MEDQAVRLYQYPGIVIGLTADHHTVQLLQVGKHFSEAFYTAVEGEALLRIVLFESGNYCITQWRNLAILFGAETA